jgi:hypothetical protein
LSIQRLIHIARAYFQAEIPLLGLPDLVTHATGHGPQQIQVLELFPLGLAFSKDIPLLGHETVTIEVEGGVV